MLNLFLALLLSSFGADKLKLDDKDDEINKIQDAIDRIKKFYKMIYFNIRKFLKCKNDVENYLKKENSNITKENNEECLIEPLSQNSSSEAKRIINPQVNLLGNKTFKQQIINASANIRKLIFKLVEKKGFELFIVIMIIFSSISLVIFSCLYT